MIELVFVYKYWICNSFNIINQTTFILYYVALIFG